ncbi:hypothetical protein WCWAEYFT_CDS0072 [Vibrio phage VB_VaC_TDDLMA]
MSKEIEEAQIEEMKEVVNEESVESEGGEDTNVLPGDSQIVNIFGRKYLADSVSPRAHAIVKDLGTVDEEIKRLETSMRVAQLARSALVINFQEESKNFTEIEVQVLKK